eukprot:g47039.t1
MVVDVGGVGGCNYIYHDPHSQVYHTQNQSNIPCFFPQPSSCSGIQIGRTGSPHHSRVRRVRHVREHHTTCLSSFVDTKIQDGRPSGTSRRQKENNWVIRKKRIKATQKVEVLDSLLPSLLNARPPEAISEAMSKEKKAETIEGLDDGDDGNLQLESQEKQLFVVPKKVALMSELVKTMAEGDTDEKVIPLPNVKANVLKLVVDYMKYHADNPPKEIEKPLKSANMTEVVGDPWDANFVDVVQELLFELILAANYMDIKPLLDLTCAKVASMIKGKTPEQIRETFNIQNDFTPEEEEAVRAENKWAEDS